MFTWIKEFLTPPVFEDTEKSRVARLLYVSLLTITTAGFLTTGITWFTGTKTNTLALLIGSVISLFSLFIVRLGKIRLVVYIIIICLLALITLLCLLGFGIHDNGIIVYPFVIIVASLLMRNRGLVIVTGLTILSIGILVVSEMQGIIQTPYKTATDVSDFFILSIVLTMIAVTIRSLSDNLVESLDHVRNKERELAKINTKLAEQAEALKASESLYRQAIEAANAVPYYQDYHANTYTFMGQGIQQLTGYSSEEMTPQIWDEITQETTLYGQAVGLPVEEAVQRARNGEFNVWNADVCIRARDGKILWVNNSAVEVLDENGVSKGSIGILTDITPRKKAEILHTILYEVTEAVHTSTDLPELYKSVHLSLGKLMDVRNFYIALCDPEKPNVFSFPYAVDEYDIFSPIEDLSGSLSAYVTRTGKPLLATPEVHEELIRTGNLKMIGVPSAVWLGTPLIIRNKVIGIAVVQNYTNPDQYTQEHIELMSFVCQQIALATERMRAQDDLRDSEARFRALIENLNDMILILNLDGTIRYASPSATRIMGYIPDKLIGRNVFELIKPEDLTRLREEWYAIIQNDNNQPGVTEARIRHADGTWHIHKGTGKNLFNDPAVHGFVLNSHDVTDNKMAEAELQRTHDELRLAYEATIEGWSRALDLRDKETEGHTQRVVDTTLRLARIVGLPEETIPHIRRGAMLHDIGKMGVPDSILQKPGPLSDDEWVIMRKHPEYAYKMLHPINYLRPALDIPLSHHEKWDGSGYPQGLRGEGIPLAARVFAIVDVWDALSSDRPYRKRLPETEVLKYIISQRGIHFDPHLVDVFMNIIV